VITLIFKSYLILQKTVKECFHLYHFTVKLFLDERFYSAQVLTTYSSLGTTYINTDHSGYDTSSILKTLEWPDENFRLPFSRNHLLGTLQKYIPPMYQVVFYNLTLFHCWSNKKVEMSHSHKITPLHPPQKEPEHNMWILNRNCHKICWLIWVSNA
jgi:hypothetical protein